MQRPICALIGDEQLRRPTAISWRDLFGYLARFIVCIMTLEFILHFMYVVAIKDRKAWVGYSAAELCMVGLWNLFVVWLKVRITPPSSVLLLSLGTLTCVTSCYILNELRSVAKCDDSVSRRFMPKAFKICCFTLVTFKIPHVISVQ